MILDVTTEGAAATADFPRQPEELTTAWLTQVLEAEGALTAGQAVDHVHFDSLSAGIGMMGTVSRLHLSYTHPGAGPATLIMKSASESQQNRGVAAHFRLYEREVNFFRDLAPMHEPQVPHALFAAYEPGTIDYVILMEDLRTYRTGDQVAGADIAQARLAVDALAQFHATWWDRTDDPRAAWVPRTNAPLIGESMVAACREGWDTMVERFAAVLPAELLAHREAYLDALPALYDAMSSGHQTLAHTDYRVDNMMFGTEPGHQPIVVLDWSAVAKSKGVQDLAYLLTQNLSDECRRLHEDELLALYHDVLRREGVTDYPAETFHADYELAVLFNFVYAIVIASALDISNDRATAFTGKLVGRSAECIVTRGLLERLSDLSRG